MKVFISWSGATSQKVALALREWLPSVIQAVEPYVSSEDIDKGARWSSDIAGELEQSKYGVICVTKENVAAPWINFEAGALSKTMDQSNVSPFLFGVKRSEVTGPLVQFQSTLVEKQDVLKLLQSINTACEVGRLENTRLEKIFENWWEPLNSQLNQIARDSEGPTLPNPAAQESPSTMVLEELLDLTRNTYQLLRDPARLLPPAYLSTVLGEQSTLGEQTLLDPYFRKELQRVHARILSALLVAQNSAMPEADSIVKPLVSAAKSLENVLDEAISIRIPRSRPRSPDTHTFPTNSPDQK